MANKKEEFRVTDRRLFTPEGEVRPDVAEEAFIQNVLYELRMAYIEVTNALARGPRPQDVSDPVPPTKMR